MRGPMLVAILALFGCGARSELDVTPPATSDASVRVDARADVEVEDAGLDVVEEPIVFVATCNPPDAAIPDDICTTPIAMGNIVQPGGCINDYAVTSGETGVLEYACDGGSSWAAVAFEGQTFPGAIQDDFVDVCISSTYPWQDGPNCGYTKSVWVTAQRIYGDYTTGTLTYTYVDKMIEGHSCWIPCFAWAYVSVQ